MNIHDVLVELNRNPALAVLAARGDENPDLAEEWGASYDALMEPLLNEGLSFAEAQALIDERVRQYLADADQSLVEHAQVEHSTNWMGTSATVEVVH